MKRKLFVIASFGIIALMVLLLGGTAFGETQAANSLPEVEFLGEGADTYQTTLDDFIVKRGQEQYDFEAGPTYDAAEGERVWAVRGTKEGPNVINNSVANLGPAYQNCAVEYVGIDDDENGIRNGFFLGGNLVELIIEGMVFQGSYVVPVSTPDHRLVAEESIAYWFTPCEEGEEPTPTNTPDPGDDTFVFAPLVMYVGEGEPPPTATPTATPETKTYSVTCDQDYEINIVDEEMHFKFAATAFENGDPFEDVELRGTLDTGSQSPSNVEETNFNGVADFTITVLTGSVTKAPVATVIFNDQGTYGSDSCTIDFSSELPPTPTPTRPPVGEPELVCDAYYDVRFIDDEDVEFKFGAIAYYNGFPLADVDLKAELDTGETRKDQIEETNFNGRADFKFEVLITRINMTPIVTIAFDDQNNLGDASCTIDSAESNDAFWAAFIERSANGK